MSRREPIPSTQAFSDGVHTRYLYTPQLIEILSSRQAPVLDLTRLNGTQSCIDVHGVAGQTIVLQTSFDLFFWTPVATNMLTTSRWTVHQHHAS